MLCSDVAVGAYLSGQVVLLRSRPIIFLHPQIKTEGHTLIDRKATFVNISLCSRYTGSSPPPNAGKSFYLGKIGGKVLEAQLFRFYRYHLDRKH